MNFIVRHITSISPDHFWPKTIGRAPADDLQRRVKIITKGFIDLNTKIGIESKVGLPRIANPLVLAKVANDVDISGIAVSNRESAKAADGKGLVLARYDIFCVDYGIVSCANKRCVCQHGEEENDA
ncbi:hypothetical protein [Undibacterium sp. TJN19]|uniref:hypothetical protein n=1 Tax=Undibacterium sp. TJN19 TaxID=3413055 RepID=UPI003BEF5C36